MEAFPLGGGAELGIVRRNQMRPAGATLRLFAQWLRPTTNKGKTNPSGLAFFCLLPRQFSVGGNS